MDSQTPYISELELISREITWDSRSTLSKIYVPGSFAVLGYMGCLVSNILLRRPPHSGVQKHILATALGLVAGFYTDKKLDERNARRDAILRHYIELHPEDFPPIERKKYKDVLVPWDPIR